MLVSSRRSSARMRRVRGWPGVDVCSSSGMHYVVQGVVQRKRETEILLKKLESNYRDRPRAIMCSISRSKQQKDVDARRSPM